MLEFIIGPFVNIMLFIYSVLGHNFGLTIIVFTVGIRLLTFPFNRSQMQSTAALQEMQNSEKWKKIQNKYKDDREKLAQEQMKLYQEMGVNPFGSCVPTLIQFPIIFALYYAVQRALAATPIPVLELARSSWLPNAAELIPLDNQFLWMDLSQPERLHLDFLPFPIPVLTILVVITSYLQSKMIQPSGGQSANPQAAGMTNTMTLMMPLMMGYFSFLYSAGLALYFFTSNLASIIQYAAMGRLNLKNILPSGLRGKGV